MENIYIIRYEENCSGEISSGIIFNEGYKTLEEARKELEICKKDDIHEYEEVNGCCIDVIENENEVIIDFGDDYNKYTIEKITIKK